ncbi:MAG: DUF1638 domain-containing protein [Thermoguttaceae bacterium]|nr:DUF1638 domain-containing protein [Thermoguttaceae bacterium]
MRFKLLACEILYREMSAAIARSPHQIDVTFLPKALHDIGQAKMLARLQEALASVNESDYEAILLGYGLCNNGVVGLTSRTIPLVLPRAHDCITLFLGGRSRYTKVFESHTGYYYLTSGWIERGENLAQDSMAARNGLNWTLEQLVEKYGEENAKFLFERLGNLTQNYHGFLYIDTHVGPPSFFEQEAQHKAKEKSFTFEKIEGSSTLIDALLAGAWDTNDFLIVPPGHTIMTSFDNQIIRLETKLDTDIC